MTNPNEATSRTLLERVRDSGDRAAWERFHALYAPLLERYARGLGLDREAAEEISADCLATLARKLSGFEYDPARGGFKGWLYHLVRGRVIDRQRRSRARPAGTRELDGIHPEAPGPEELWERTWRHEHIRFALHQASALVSERTYQVFQLLLIEELTVAEVCERMGMSANQVYKAKARVLRRVRELLARLGTDAPLP